MQFFDLQQEVLLGSLAVRPFNWICALLIALLLAAHGLRKKSLSKSGALAAFSVGLLGWGCGPRFGLTMILFYYSSSKLTKWKGDFKRKYEEDYKEGGQRDASQVLSCSAPAVAVGLVHFLMGFEPSSVLDIQSYSVATVMKSFILGFYACCCGDTWASEIGILDKQPKAVLVLPPFSSVPKGTNGGVSLLGTLGSLLGGIFIGLVFWLTSGCAGGVLQLLWQLFLGILGGVGGSILDSIMGATMQASYWDPQTHKVVSNPAAITEEKAKGLLGGSRLQRITGYNILSNHAVNILSATLTGLGIACVRF